MSVPSCRFCHAPLSTRFVDLGLSPLCQNIIPLEDASKPEAFYPLDVFVCGSCKLVQLDEFVSPSEIFTEYAYFSSYSDSLVAHAKKYVESMVTRLGLTSNDLAVEIASNDGYLLQHFLPLGIPVTGIEPAKNVGAVAREKGIPVVHKFMGVETATQFLAERGAASLLIGNNVLAHVPNINDFVEGMRILLAPGGTITMEFPHLLRLIEGNQFDTIYHEHFSYLSLIAVEKIFAAHGLTIFDVDELKIHGGSIRIYAQHTNIAPKLTSGLLKVRADEATAGFDTMAAYSDFGERVKLTKNRILSKLIELKSQGKTIVGYGAPGKGNTLLNFCGIRTDYLDYTVDRNVYKQGKLLPGSRIPVNPVEKISETKPDYVFILPWNLTKEITGQLSYIREWGGKFIVPIPEVSILD
ncbi:MAG: class I SAM-dependent methyltransferase [Chthoniobacterales bacterium]